MSNTIGLLDWDLTRWQQPIGFNLEIMKLARYHKSKKRFVQSLHEVDTLRYGQIYLRKDFEDYDYPSEVFNNPKVECGGRVFTNGKHDKLQDELDYLAPDASIYQNMKRYYNSTASTRRMFDIMLRGTHFRLSFDDKVIDKNFRKQYENVGITKGAKSFILHDKDIVQLQNSYETIFSIGEEIGVYNTFFGFKYPLTFYDIDTLFKWLGLKRLNLFNSILVCFIPTGESIIELKNKYLVKKIQFNFSSEDLFSEDTLIQLYLSSVFAGEHGIEILLNITDEKNLDERWRMFFKLFTHYIYNYINRRNRKKFFSFFTFCKYTITDFLPKDVLRVFTFIQEENYELFKLFYECIRVVIKNGEYEVF